LGSQVTLQLCSVVPYGLADFEEGGSASDPPPALQRAVRETEKFRSLSFVQTGGDNLHWDAPPQGCLPCGEHTWVAVRLGILDFENCIPKFTAIGAYQHQGVWLDLAVRGLGLGIPSGMTVNTGWNEKRPLIAAE